MNNQEKIEQLPKTPDIKFDKTEATLLISADRSTLDLEPIRTMAEAKHLTEKAEIHLTIIGSDTGETILASLEKLPEGERESILSQIYDLAKNTDWKINFKPEFYYIKKEYNDPDPQNQDQTIPEVRESVIQLADLENLETFYDQLEGITGLQFEVPFPHATLFTTSTREDKKQRGIGIYSEKDFKSLTPEKIDPNLDASA